MTCKSDLPNVLLPGFPKAASTTLSFMVLAMARKTQVRKEFHYYTRPGQAISGDGRFGCQETAYLDGSQSYLVSPSAYSHLKEAYSDRLIVVSVRDPLSRALSQYKHENYISRLGIPGWWKKDLEILSMTCWEELCEYEAYITRSQTVAGGRAWYGDFRGKIFQCSNYDFYLKRFSHYFDPKNIFIAELVDGKNFTQLGKFLEIPDTCLNNAVSSVPNLNESRVEILPPKINLFLKNQFSGLRKFTPIRRYYRSFLTKKIALDFDLDIKSHLEYLSRTYFTKFKEENKVHEL